MKLESLLGKGEFDIWRDALVFFDDGSSARLVDVLEEEGYPRYFVVRLNHKTVAIPSSLASEYAPERVVFVMERWQALDLPMIRPGERPSGRMIMDINNRLYAMGLIDRLSRYEYIPDRAYDETQAFPEQSYERELHDVYPSEKLISRRVYYADREYEPAYGWPNYYILVPEVLCDRGWRAGGGASTRTVRHWETVD